MIKHVSRALALGAVFAAGLAVGQWMKGPVVRAQATPTVFELRTYTAPPGKLGDLNTRFREHTTKLFEKHGMVNIGYWIPMDAPAKDDTLIYIVAHDSREAADASWKAFGADPDWHKVRDASEVNGKIVAKVERVYMTATDYSPLK